MYMYIDYIYNIYTNKRIQFFLTTYIVTFYLILSLVVVYCNIVFIIVTLYCIVVL